MTSLTEAVCEILLLPDIDCGYVEAEEIKRVTKIINGQRQAAVMEYVSNSILPIPINLPESTAIEMLQAERDALRDALVASCEKIKSLGNQNLQLSTQCAALRGALENAKKDLEQTLNNYSTMEEINQSKWAEKPYRFLAEALTASPPPVNGLLRLSRAAYIEIIEGNNIDDVKSAVEALTPIELKLLEGIE